MAVVHHPFCRGHRGQNVFTRGLITLQSDYYLVEDRVDRHSLSDWQQYFSCDSASCGGAPTLARHSFVGPRNRPIAHPRLYGHYRTLIIVRSARGRSPFNVRDCGKPLES